MKIGLLICMSLIGYILLSFNTVDNSQSIAILLKQANERFSKKYKIKAVATSIASPGGIVKLLGLDFKVKGPLTKREIRKILVDCAQQFVSMINASEEIRPHLHHYPFTIKDVQFGLFLEDENGEDIYDPKIGIAGITNGKLSYMTLKLVDKIAPIHSDITETYEEALEAIEKDGSR